MFVSLYSEIPNVGEAPGSTKVEHLLRLEVVVQGVIQTLGSQREWLRSELLEASSATPH